MNGIEDVRVLPTDYDCNHPSHRDTKTFLLYEFPAAKSKIASLKYEQKLEWYQHQFEKKPGVYPSELTTPEFQRFWKWRVLVPMKIGRWFFRVKNFEVFKRYPDITKIRKAREKGPERI